MKKEMLGIFALAMMAVFAGCGGSGAAGSAAAGSAARPASSGGAVSMGEHKALVAYFSRSGHTRALAEVIQKETGADIFEIRPAEPYPADYNGTVARFRQERAGNVRPALADQGPDLSGYDVVFVGYPNWGSDMPPVVKTYLAGHDFSGKTVVPFCTNGGGGWGRSVESLKELAPSASVAEGYEMQGGQVDEGRVADWLRHISL